MNVISPKRTRLIRLAELSAEEREDLEVNLDQLAAAWSARERAELEFQEAQDAWYRFVAAGGHGRGESAHTKSRASAIEAVNVCEAARIGAVERLAEQAIGLASRTPAESGATPLEACVEAIRRWWPRFELEAAIEEAVFAEWPFSADIIERAAELGVDLAPFSDPDADLDEQLDAVTGTTDDAMRAAVGTLLDAAAAAAHMPPQLLRDFSAVLDDIVWPDIDA